MARGDQRIRGDVAQINQTQARYSRTAFHRDERSSGELGIGGRAVVAVVVGQEPDHMGLPARKAEGIGTKRERRCHEVARRAMRTVGVAEGWRAIQVRSHGMLW